MSKPVDVLIVGAGISGLSMAVHLQRHCPDRRFAIAEARARAGGTWDLFRYPGVRSDSDMHTLGFAFAPWRGDKAIAAGADILAYLDAVIAEHSLAPHISYGTRVLAADWREAEALWHVTLADAAGERVERARFLYLAAGYYDYERPYQADIPGLENFAGPVVHPQFWPPDLDWGGKRVVVIGSGATAVTLVPALAERAAQVTMLQRTPSWMVAQPSIDRLARALRRVLPEKTAYRLTRWINTRLHVLIYNRARQRPDQVAALLTRRLKRALGAAYDPRHFLPPYPPWEQRLCLVPDGDLFRAIREGRAGMATGVIAKVQADGVRLTDGTHIAADILVTATGLTLAIGGKIAVSLDGAPVDWSKRWFYRNAMFSNLPNLAVVFGYLNASWTLRADMTAAYVTRVLAEMARRGADVAVPLRTDDAPEKAVDPTFGFSSGYLARAASLMPRSEAALPWRLNMDYLADLADYRTRPVDDGVLAFLVAGQSPVAEKSELP
ncbi:flavin-containing monooxygenase [Alteraurantiacibacter palmitatis]|uniref:Flavin-containing monooxygenase n=1 Tax=Alteraurantiacibacter palmitatis TaxID=2054628 RepID=A0ABV7E4Q7_9SPHN